MKINKFTLGLTVFVLLLVSAYWFNNQGQSVNNLPAYARRTERIGQAYTYAVENKQFLSEIPCYCNCHRQGHQNVEDCFISSFKTNGKVVFDSHGANCGICYSIVHDAMNLKEQGKSTQEIEKIIDSKYSQYGRPNKV